MIKLEVTWLDDSITHIQVAAWDGYWIAEINEMTVWFADKSDEAVIMSGVKSAKKLDDLSIDIMYCNLCKHDTDTLFEVTIYGVGKKDLCAKCYLRMLPNPDRTARMS